jgi:hypothetical protein
MSKVWYCEWKSQVYHTSGNGINSALWPAETIFSAKKNEEIGCYQVLIDISRTKDDLKTFKLPYLVEGQFVFNGTTVETKEVVENIIPFSATVSDKLCNHFTVVVNMPLGNNDFWPECKDGVFTLRYSVCNQQTNSLNSMLKESKSSYDMFVCGKDGKAVGFHECVAKVNCPKLQIPPFTSPTNSFPLKVGSEKSIRFVVYSMYQMSQETKEGLPFWKEVYAVAIAFNFIGILPEVELKMVQQKLSFVELLALSKEYPNVSVVQKKMLEVVSKDMNSYMAFMDSGSGETEK